MANQYTLAEAQACRAAAMQNYLSSMNAEEYKVGSRMVRRANPESLWRELDKWDRIVASLGGQMLSPIVTKRVVPHDR